MKQIFLFLILMVSSFTAFACIPPPNLVVNDDQKNNPVSNDQRMNDEALFNLNSPANQVNVWNQPERKSNAMCMVMVKKTKCDSAKYQVGALSFQTEADINASQNLKGKIMAISTPAEKIFSS